MDQVRGRTCRYAVYKALSFLKKENIGVKIYTDNESVFMLLNGASKLRNRKKKKDNLLHKIYARCMHILKQHNEVEIYCVKSHTGIYGNEIANVFAQSARNDGDFLIRGKRKYKVPTSDRINRVISKFKKIS